MKVLSRVSNRNLTRLKMRSQMNTSTNNKGTSSYRRYLNSYNRVNANSTKVEASKVKSEAFDLYSTISALNNNSTYKDNSIQDLQKGVNSFIEAYNTVMEDASKTAGSAIKTSAKELAKVCSNKSDDLNKLGISINSDGKLSVNKETLSNAETKDIKKVFGGYNSFGSELIKKTLAFVNTCSVENTYRGYSNSSYSQCF